MSVTTPSDDFPSGEPFGIERTRFAQVPHWVAEAVKPTALAVYVHMAWKYANGDRTCYPTQQQIADSMSVPVRTVQDALRELRKADAIVVRRSRRDDGKLGRNAYWMPMDHARGAVDGPAAADQGSKRVSAGRNQARDAVGSPATASRASGNQTHEGNQKNQTAAAVASEALFEVEQAKEPEPKAPTVNQRANVLAQRHYERLGKMGNVPAFAKIAKQALVRDWPDRAVDQAMAYIAENQWTLTAERLANTLKGGPKPPSRPAPARPSNGAKRVGNQLLEY